MLLTSKSGTLKKDKFDNKIYKKDSSALVVTTDYTKTDPSTKSNCTVLKANVIEVGVGHTLVPGDAIQIIGSDGVARDNYVQNIGNTVIEIKDNVKPSNSLTVDVVIDFYTITFNSIDEGEYYFTDGEILIISEVYLNLFVSYATLLNRWAGVSRDITMDSLNSEALKSVLADFSYLPSFYRKMDSGQIRELLILKILTFIKKDADRIQAILEYDTYLKSMSLIVTRDSDGSLDKDITDETVDNRPSLNIRYGAC